MPFVWQVFFEKRPPHLVPTLLFVPALQVNCVLDADFAHLGLVKHGVTCRPQIAPTPREVQKLVQQTVLGTLLPGSQDSEPPITPSPQTGLVAENLMIGGLTAVAVFVATDTLV